MRLAIMQPYFLPYIGYFQLIESVDQFVVYDEIKYTKKGWINRNRIATRNGIKNLTVNLEKSSDADNIRDKKISTTYNREKEWNFLRAEYRSCQYFEENSAVLQKLLLNEGRDLFEYIYSSLVLLSEHLGIKTKLTRSSGVGSGTNLKGAHRVVDICSKLGATHYVNLPGGRGLYDTKLFADEGIKLSFLEPNLFEYKQPFKVFVPNLSIVDVLFRAGLQRVRGSMVLRNV